MFHEPEQLEPWTWLVQLKDSTAKPLTVTHATYQGAKLLACGLLRSGNRAASLDEVECRAVNVTDLERVKAGKVRAA